MLAKLTAKNKLTLPKSVTNAVGPADYFDVEVKDGQVILTPMRIQRAVAVRAKLAALGKPLRPLDLMIAAHALAEGATLVTADRAFAQVPGLATQDYEQIYCFLVGREGFEPPTKGL